MWERTICEQTYGSRYPKIILAEDLELTELAEIWHKTR